MINLNKFNNYIIENPISSNKKIIKLTKLIQNEKIMDNKILKNIEKDMEKADEMIKKLKEGNYL